MGNSIKSSNSVSRRKFIGLSAAAAAFSIIPENYWYGSQPGVQKGNKPDSRFGGVQVGTITYSWRSMPQSAEEILQYCLQTGISSIEWQGYAAEEYAGIPRGSSKEAREAQRKWRISASMKRFEDLRKMYNDAGVNIHILKFEPDNWSDEELDYSFNVAKTLGAMGVSTEIGDVSAKRLGAFAQKHGMYAVLHQHQQPGEPGWTFDKFLEDSPANMLNFDAGHYYGATGLHPNGIIERLHDRIVSVHIKDKTGPKSNPPDTNMPWGKGETPIADILLLIKKSKWPIIADIELEYPVPEGSDAVAEVKKCVEYCKAVLI
jgi:sugar phosphate isomerase/epimerase